MNKILFFFLFLNLSYSSTAQDLNTELKYYLEKASGLIDDGKYSEALYELQEIEDLAGTTYAVVEYYKVWCYSEIQDYEKALKSAKKFHQLPKDQTKWLYDVSLLSSKLISGTKTLIREMDYKKANDLLKVSEAVSIENPLELYYLKAKVSFELCQLDDFKTYRNLYFKQEVRKGSWDGELIELKRRERDIRQFSEEILSNMVEIEGGSFKMGGKYNSARRSVEDYKLNKFEITVAQWEAFMGKGYYAEHYADQSTCKDCPVNAVSWDAIQLFIEKLNAISGQQFRLPKSAEWEYAAKGGKLSKKYTYPGSDNLGNVAWYENNSDKKVHPVGQKQPNELGLYDLVGNVSEWCLDTNRDNYRYVRGGSFWFNPNGYTIWNPDVIKITDSNSNTRGFRLAM